MKRAMALVLFVLVSGGVSGASSVHQGQSLGDALTELGQRGVRVVYSSRLVTEDMQVLTKPTGKGPEEILREILAPHGLGIQKASGGRLVVVQKEEEDEPRVETAVVRGQVVDVVGRPLEGVEIKLGDQGPSVWSDEDGGYTILSADRGVYNLQARREDLVVETRRGVVVKAGSTTNVSFRMTPTAVATEEILVTSSLRLLTETPTSALVLERDRIAELPHFGDDFFRVFSSLPSTTAGDISAEFVVRGGFYNEVLVELDGVELFEPFHLKDFQGIFSVLDPKVLSEAELIPGSFPVEYGDRMTGVLDLTTRTPSATRTDVGVSFSNLWLGSSGVFANDRGRWLGSLRRGYLDMVLKFAVDDDDGTFDPSIQYWDGLGKLDFDLGPRDNLGFQFLVARDEITWVDDSEPDEKLEIDTSYGNDYGWVFHSHLVADRAFFETRVAAGTIPRKRLLRYQEFYATDNSNVYIHDVRDVEVVDVRHSWEVEAGERHSLQWGLEARRTTADYDYVNDIDIDEQIDDPRFPPNIRTTRFDDVIESDHLAAYVSDRMRFGERLTLELGARYDRQSLTDEDQLSPRVNALWDTGRWGAIRAGWGHFYQSQRPHELQVEYGETDFYPAQKAEHWTLGYEGDTRAGRLRVDGYYRNVSNPRPRYENLFDPFAPAPEASIDRIRISADRVRAFGIETFLSGRRGAQADWWVSYTWSNVEDHVEGRWQNRSVDQTHAFTASLTYRPTPKWSLTALFTHHTGWPSTEVTGWEVTDPDGEETVHYQVGPFYEQRYPAYHRLDFRASRTRRLGRGVFTFFVDVRNVYDRDNVRGLNVTDPEPVGYVPGSQPVRFPVEYWLGIIPSLGVSWEF